MNGMDDRVSTWRKHQEKVKKRGKEINTDDLSVRETGVIACDHIVKSMRKKYINEFKSNNGMIG